MKRTRHRGRRCQPRLDELESRCTPAFAASFNSLTHVLSITGTAEPDQGILSRRSDDILLDGNPTGATTRTTAAIVINPVREDNRITIDVSAGLLPEVVLSGRSSDKLFLIGSEDGEVFQVHPGDGDRTEIDVRSGAADSPGMRLSADVGAVVAEGRGGNDRFEVCGFLNAALALFGQEGDDGIAQRIECSNNLEQPGIDSSKYHDPNGTLLPAAYSGGAGNDLFQFTASNHAELIEMLGVDQELPDPEIRTTDEDGRVRFDSFVRETERFVLDTNGGDDRLAIDWDEHWVGVQELRITTGAGSDTLQANLRIPREAEVVFNAELADGDDSAAISWVNPPDGDLPRESESAGAVWSAQIEVHGGRGNDTLSMVVGDPSIKAAQPLNGNLAAKLAGDAGADSAIIVNFNVEVNGRADYHVDGWTGNDALSIQAANVSLGAGAVFTATATGGDGADLLDQSLHFREVDAAALVSAVTEGGAGAEAIAMFLLVEYAGLTAHLRMTADGGDGADSISANVELMDSTQADLDVRVAGGLGDDDLTITIFGFDDPELLAALVDGGRGDDLFHGTRNVLVRDCEELYWLD